MWVGRIEGRTSIKYLTLADNGVQFAYGNVSKAIIEIHVEKHHTDAFVQWVQHPHLRVEAFRNLEPGDCSIDVCLQETGGGPYRSLDKTSHIYGNVTVP